MKNIQIFYLNILRFSFICCKIFNIFEEACFRYELHVVVCQCTLATIKEYKTVKDLLLSNTKTERVGLQ